MKKLLDILANIVFYGFVIMVIGIAILITIFYTKFAITLLAMFALLVIFAWSMDRKGL